MIKRENEFAFADFIDMHFVQTTYIHEYFFHNHTCQQ